MAKFDYPKNNINVILDDYLNLVNNSCKIDKVAINNFLAKSGLNLSFNEFLILPFDKLIDYAKYFDNYKTNKILTLSAGYSKSLVDLKVEFNYSEILGTSISPFFMKYSSLLNIRTCYYCNIDFVNSYIPFKNDYFNFFDLIRTGDIDDLTKIKGITKANAKIIKKKCNGILETLVDLNDKLQDYPEILTFLNNIKNSDDSIRFENLKDQKNHYTIDHILPQNEFPFFSLCLFNLIPSCYTCNSKLKKSKMLSSNYDDISKNSPTSASYSNPLEFKILYQNSFSNNNLPSQSSQFKVQLNLANNHSDFLNLQGRYNFHKSESLSIINKRKIYSDSQIVEIATYLKMDVKEIKKHLFGHLLYDDNSNEPFEKYKKDIAKQLGIL